MIRLVMRTSLVLALVAGGLLLLDSLQLILNPPLANPVLEEVLQELGEKKDDDRLAEAYRTLQYQSRQALFTLRAQTDLGRYLVLAGLGIFFVLLQWSSLSRRTAGPPPSNPEGHRETAPGEIPKVLLLWAVILGAGGLGATIVPGLLEAGLPALPGLAGSAPKAGAPTLAADRRGNWSAFRGQAGTSVGDDAAVPVQWDGESGEGILWKVDPQLPGFSSPVIWEDTVFLTGGDSAAFLARGFDAGTGELRWDTVLKDTSGLTDLPEVSADTGYSAATPAADALGFYAVFANGDVFALDFGGKIRWTVSLGVPDNIHGHSSSLITYAGLVLVQYDHGAQARVLALDSATGAEVWTADRTETVTTSWSSPILAEKDGGAVLIINGNPWLMAYDPLTGKELWRQECLGGEVAPGSATWGNRIFAANEYVALTAMSLEDGSLLWKDEEGPLPDVSSPVARDGWLFVASGYGEMALYRADSGERLWTVEEGAGAYSSPLFLGGKIYLFDKEGTAFVINPGPQPEFAAENTLGEGVLTTPAVYRNSFILRGEKHLWRIGGQP